MLSLEEAKQKTPEELYFLLAETEKSLSEKNNLLDNHKEVIEEKTNLIAEKENLISQHELQIDQLRWRLNKLINDTYGKRSEKAEAVLQGSLFDEAGDIDPDEPVLDLETGADDDEIVVAEHKRKKTGRPALPTNLPRITKIYDLSDEEKQCSCGCKLVKIGEKKKEQLEFIPAQVRVIEHVRYQYACRGCEDTMKLADMPKQPIPKSIASPGLLSHVLVSKFQDHLPFYRQEYILGRMGIDLSRRSFCTWAQQCAELLKPLVEAMRSRMNAYDIGYSDETRVQVLKEPDRKAESKSYMWLFIGGDPDERCFVYQYSPSRGHQIPKAFWSDFNGYLHTDGFSAYQTLFKEGTIQGIHCLAHARRKFMDAAKQSKKPTLANWAVKQMAKLYKLEKRFTQENFSPQQIHETRQKKAKPILDKLKEWLDDQLPKVPPQHPIAEAIKYTLRFWDNLIRYIDDGRFEIDNNRTERGIKPFVIGRKNWMFHDSVSGAEAGAIIYSLIETCKAHKINAYLYLRYVLQEIPNGDKSKETYRSLLPFNIKPENLQWDPHS